ncbi:hypothetical protein C8R44DRAFT_904250 [Mycena epipterygia]|nr:hypothetical protein C8R44DRAFT_904250 [Mycena epipterygia]
MAKTHSALQDVVIWEHTIHMHKRVHECTISLFHSWSFKKHAPKVTPSLLQESDSRAVKSVIDFAQKTMGTTDVRIDPKLNKEIWA